MTIISVAGAAMFALAVFNKKKARDPEGAERAVSTVRQSLSVILSIGDALWSLLDALMFFTNRRTASAPTKLRPIGSNLAADVAPA